MTATPELRDHLDGGLVPIPCDTCGQPVRAGRRSEMQTSVQWSGPSCERLTTLAGDRPPALVPTCPALRDSLDRAIREGRLEVS
ncbi:hypothetical protein [Actinoplanes sp. G11-F43]|uniref:hypothetical protein n=1 Tax=Actinoplanes sp. G11-F43 TaxID=3424130 RepID=UPI003D33FC32